jgi:hypothetical protein
LACGIVKIAYAVSARTNTTSTIWARQSTNGIAAPAPPLPIHDQNRDDLEIGFSSTGAGTTSTAGAVTTWSTP